MCGHGEKLEDDLEEVMSVRYKMEYQEFEGAGATLNKVYWSALRKLVQTLMQKPELNSLLIVPWAECLMENGRCGHTFEGLLQDIIIEYNADPTIYQKTRRYAAAVEDEESMAPTRKRADPLPQHQGPRSMQGGWLQRSGT